MKFFLLVYVAASVLLILGKDSQDLNSRRLVPEKSFLADVHNLHKAHTSLPVYDPTVCRDPLWRAAAAKRKLSQRSKTFAIVVPVWVGTSKFQRKTILSTISNIRRFSNTPVSVVLVAGDREKIKTHKLHNEIVNRGYEDVFLYTRRNPVNSSALPNKFFQQQGGVDGLAEYALLLTVGLPFDKVLVLSVSSEIVKGIDHLFDCDEDSIDVMFSGALAALHTTSLLMVPGNAPSLVDHLVSQLYDLAEGVTESGCVVGKDKVCEKKPHWTTAEILFVLLNLGTRKLRWIQKTHSTARHVAVVDSGNVSEVKQEENSWLRPLVVVRLDQCLYNYQKSLDCEWLGPYVHGTGLSPYVMAVTAANSGKGKDGSTHRPHIVKAETFKRCAPDFWVLGTRKGGTTALYTWLTEHPDVAPLHLTKQGRGGEVFIKISESTLEEYNSEFIVKGKKRKKGKSSKDDSVRNDSMPLLTGDAWVSRLDNDAKNMADMCGHSHVKYFVLLRDPIERAYSNVLMRERANFRKDVTATTNVTQYMLNHLNDFKNAVGKHSHRNWPEPRFPGDFTHLEDMGTNNIIYVGLYYIYLRQWFFHSGIDNIRIYFTEDFGKYTSLIVKDAIRHLGLDDTKDTPNEESLNKVANARDKSVALPDHELMSPLLIEQLKETFAPYNRKLEVLLNTTVPWGY